MTFFWLPGRWPRALRFCQAALTALTFWLAPWSVSPAFGGWLQPLPELGLSAAGTTVSSLSSGGYRAGPFHMAFSAALFGVAVKAAGPCGCSRGSVAAAMYPCSCPTNPTALQRWQNQVPGAGCSVLAPSFDD